MIYLRLSPGMANAMLEYAAGYSLSRELGTELVLDIAEHNDSIWPYMLDLFKITPYKKVRYYLTERSHVNTEYINKILTENASVLVENPSDEKADDGILHYNDLKDSKWVELAKNKDLYLCGYFFGKKYYKKYWNELCEQFIPRDAYEEIEMFKELIDGKISIGVHIRRGDMIFASWAVDLSAEYYMAAIEWCRRNIQDCVFYIFTDDKDYARAVLGTQEDIRFVNVIAGYEADLLEFICLSLCTHRIISNSSTYSRVADELNGKPGRVLVKKRTDYGRRAFVKDIFKPFRKVQTVYDAEEKETIVSLSDMDKRQYSKRYKKNFNIRKESKTDVNHLLSIENGDRLLKEIAMCSFDAYSLSRDDKYKLMRKKMSALFELKKYDRVIDIAHFLYSRYRKDQSFRKEYTESLMYRGFPEEAEVEANSYDCDIRACESVSLENKVIINKTTRQRKYIILGWQQESVYASLTVEMKWADILTHLGHNVILISDDTGSTSNAYLKATEGKLFVNATGVESCYISYRRETALQMGIETIAQKHFPEIDLSEVCVISRNESDYDLVPQMKAVHITEIADDPNRIETIEGEIRLDYVHRMDVNRIREISNMLNGL